MAARPERPRRGSRALACYLPTPLHPAWMLGLRGERMLSVHTQTPIRSRSRASLPAPGGRGWHPPASAPARGVPPSVSERLPRSSRRSGLSGCEVAPDDRAMAANLQHAALYYLSANQVVCVKPGPMKSTTSVASLPMICQQMLPVTLCPEKMSKPLSPSTGGGSGAWQPF
jgi:hypothetical protein